MGSAAQNKRRRKWQKQRRKRKRQGCGTSSVPLAVAQDGLTYGPSPPRTPPRKDDGLVPPRAPPRRRMMDDWFASPLPQSSAMDWTPCPSPPRPRPRLRHEGRRQPDPLPRRSRSRSHDDPAEAMGSEDVMDWTPCPSPRRRPSPSARVPERSTSPQPTSSSSSSSSLDPTPCPSPRPRPHWAPASLQHPIPEEVTESSSSEREWTPCPSPRPHTARALSPLSAGPESTASQSVASLSSSEREWTPCPSPRPTVVPLAASDAWFTGPVTPGASTPVIASPGSTSDTSAVLSQAAVLDSTSVPATPDLSSSPDTGSSSSTPSEAYLLTPDTDAHSAYPFPPAEIRQPFSPGPSGVAQDPPSSYAPPIKGFHVSSDGGLPALAERVAYLRQKVPGWLGIQHFCGNPRSSRQHKPHPDDIAQFNAHMGASDISTRWWTMHASHSTNLSSADSGVAERAIDFVANEMRNCNALGVPTLCVHLGSDVKNTSEEVIVRTIAVLRVLLATVPRVNLALENMVRRATSCGGSWSLRVLQRIVEEVDSSRLLLCVDVCHAYIAEYDFASPSGLEDFMTLLGEVGDKVAGVHVSDSATPHGRVCEGHANLGDGLIPLAAFRRILTHPALLSRVPYYLETPNYFTSLRPIADAEIAALELEGKTVEWSFLARLLRIPEDELGGLRIAGAVEVYKKERERVQQRIRNRLRDAGSDVAKEKFGVDRWESNSRRARIRKARGEMLADECGRSRSGSMTPPSISSVTTSSLAASEEVTLPTPSVEPRWASEAALLAPASWRVRGRYTLRRTASTPAR